MNNYIKEIKALLMLTLVFTAVLLFFNLPTLIYSTIGLKPIIIFLLSYVVILILSSVLNRFIKYSFFSKLKIICFSPLTFLYILLTFVIPIGIIIIHVMLYFGISFVIPEFIYWACRIINNQLISKQTHIYLLISLASFNMVILNFQLRGFVHRISPARFKDSKKLKPYQLEKISEYLLSENNVRFIVYSIYVIVLISINVTNFQSNKQSINIFEKPILQSFVTFIAFDRAVGIMKNLNFKPSDFLKMLVISILNKLKNIENKDGEDND